MDQPNRAHWDTLAAFHGTGADRYYDVDALIRGVDAMTDIEEAALVFATGGKGVRGLDVIHIQSHIGFDSITMARRGATVTAVDFSRVALEKAHAIAERCGVTIDTVEADSRALPHELDGRFDLAYATIGVLCWIDDIDAWMEGATRVLRPGGRLVLSELHPIVNMFETREPLLVDFAYGGGTSMSWTGTGSYANKEADFETTTVQYAWSLSDIVNAAVGAGLRIDRLDEHLDIAFDPRGDFLDHDSDGRYRFRLGVGPDGTPRSAPPFPLMFTVIATKQDATR